MIDAEIAIMVGLLVGSLGLGWAAGRGIKAIRQFFDQI